MPVIQFNDVWEMYRIKFFQKRNVAWESFWALKDVNFSVEKGETVGIIGENGAGKSTVLKLVAGLLKPDRGAVGVEGRVSGLLELGAGFQPELTGEENITLSAGLFGLSRQEIEARREAIVHFASLGKFINAPVKCYSQGMFVRLAFAIAVHVDPDILLIDDTLAVGDEYFQKKCIQRIFELKDQKKTILFVTHDTNLLRQLCRRALLFKEGHLVKDGAVDVAISTCLQTIGEKKGITGLEEGSFKLIFNNGRLFINSSDLLLTPGLGAHLVLRSENKWVSSQEFDWEIEKKEGDHFYAKGKLSSPSLTQTWRVGLKNGQIDWQVTSDAKEILPFQEACANIMVTRGYKHWFTTLEEGEFMSQGQASWNWQAFLDNNVGRKSLGVKTQDGGVSSHVPLIFQQLGSYQAQIFNSDDFLNCRLLQFKITSFKNNPQDNEGQISVFTGKILLDPVELAPVLDQAQEEFVLKRGRHTCIFDNGRLIILRDGKKLTKGDHASISFFANGRWYSSVYAQWEFKKEGANKLIARGGWHNLPLVQVWEIEIEDEGEIKVRSGLDVKANVIIEQQDLTLRFSSDYKYWFTDFEAQEFPDEFREVFYDVAQRCFSTGKIGLGTTVPDVPTVAIKFAEDLGNFAKIGNSDVSHGARELKIARVEPEGKIQFGPGFVPCFDLAMSLGVQEEPVVLKKAELALNDRMRVIFDKGSLRLLQGTRELTKRHAFYTSVRHNGRWHDSVLGASWKVEEHGSDVIRAKGRWRELPLEQEWTVKLDGNNRISLELQVVINKEMEFDRLQTNLMLSEKYLQWQAEGSGGDFPDFNGAIDDDWDCVGQEGGASEGNGRWIGVRSLQSQDLPSVSLLLNGQKNSGMLNVINSDLYFRGRVLQYLNKGKTLLPEGTHLFFKGAIVIAGF